MNLRLSEDTTATLSSILAGDLSGLPRDEAARAVTETTRVEEFFQGDVLTTVVEAAQVAPSDRLGDALEKYTAHVRARALQQQQQGQQQAPNAAEIAV